MFSVEEFRFITRDDIFDKKYIYWSRIYEYPYVINKLKELGAHKNSLIHNTSWGFEGVHVMFKEDMDSIYENVYHTDIKPSRLPKTGVYNITTEPIKEEIEKYDFVVNISTVEEVSFDNIKIIQNLLKQVKKGGYLIITFDYNFMVQLSEGKGSINIGKVQRFLNQKINDEGSHITGENSEIRETRCSYLKCGVMVLRKEE